MNLPIRSELMGHKSSCKHEGRGTWEWNYPGSIQSSMTKRNQSWRHPLELRDAVNRKIGTALGFLATHHSKCILFKLLAWFSLLQIVKQSGYCSQNGSTTSTNVPYCDTDKMMVTPAATSLWVTCIPIDTKKEFAALPSTDSRNTELLDMSGF